MELKHILEILYRRRWIVINTFLAIFLTIVICTLLITPVYDSKAMVFLQKSSAASTLLSSLGMQGGNAAPTSYSDTDRSDYLALAQVYPVCEKVIKDKNLSRERTRAVLMRKFPFLKTAFRSLGVDVEDTTQAIEAEDLVNSSLLSYVFPRPYVKVDQYESTNLIYFEAKSQDPEQASALANAMARAFIQNEVKRIRGDFEGAKEYIESNITRYKKEYTTALLSLREFKEREKSIDLDTETSEFLRQISDLKLAQRDLHIQLAQTRTKYNPEHPAVKDYENAINEITQLIQQKMEKVFGAEKLQSDPALRDLNQKAAGFPALSPDKTPTESPRENSRKGAYDDMFMSMPQKSYKYAQLNLAVSVTQNVYQSLLTYSYQVGIAESIAVSNVYMVQEGKTPAKNDSKHKSPNVGLNTFMAIFLGTIFGVGSGFLAEYLDDTVKTSDDLKALKASTFLGRVIKLSRKEVKLIDQLEPRSPLRETFRNIRTSIKFATIDKPAKIILVTSSVQGEGKSFVASNLAISVATEGKRVLMIDCDMRRPCLHQYFGLENHTGLTNYLAGDVPVESIKRQVNVNGLTLITTGPIPPDPGKLVESRKMSELLENMKNEYDLVIVDTPPIFAASDALAMSGCTDCTIIVIESGKTNRTMFTDTSEALRKANMEVVGVVLNKVAGREASYHYYYKYNRK